LSQSAVGMLCGRSRAQHQALPVQPLGPT
jgi:hypothetical protein